MAFVVSSYHLCLFLRGIAQLTAQHDDTVVAFRLYDLSDRRSTVVAAKTAGNATKIVRLTAVIGS